MDTRRAPTKGAAPSLALYRSIELLRQCLDEFNRINALPMGSPEVDKWSDTSETILHNAFGKPNGRPHKMTSAFTRYCVNMPDIYEREYRHGMLQKKAVLESCIEQLEDACPSPTAPSTRTSARAKNDPPVLSKNDPGGL